MQNLKKAQMPQLSTLIFAEPTRQSSPKWQSLFTERGVSFLPVVRSGLVSEPNDEAILMQAGRLCQQSDVSCIVLFTKDTVLMKRVMHQAKMGMKEFWLVVLDTKVSGTDTIESQASRVFRLQLPRTVPFKVRALLHSDASGEVFLEDTPPLSGADARKQKESLHEFLIHKQFCSAEDNTHHAAVKCWYEHVLLGALSSPLPVFPTEATIQFMCEAVAGSARQPSARTGNYALCLPHAPAMFGLSKANQTVYGSRLQRAILRGGAPFIMPESDDLAVQVLKRLGYIDSSLNTSVVEGLLVFINGAKNKKQLLTMGLLPSPEDTVKQALCLLHRAFLSNRLPPLWQRAPPDDQKVRDMLQKQGLISSTTSTKHEVLAAMMKLSERKRQCGHKMKTYNGLVWSLTRFVVLDDPMRREAVFLKNDGCH
ncbi:unnamed protein product [Symbiodinium natans]|uniref:Uncharacterized protein n=1 Tax=Symbiodinium natans TaxID=878477 RepID=A0A812SF12_9DINO|nr:unnamed protein product [Symbiodinium natans]